MKKQENYGVPTPGTPSSRSERRRVRREAIARGAIPTPRKRPSGIFNHNSGRMTGEGRKGEAR